MNRPSPRRARAISFGEREPARLAPEGSGQVVEVSAVQLGLKALAFAGGVSSVDGRPRSIGCRPSAVRFRTGSEPVQLFGEWRIGSGDGAVDGLGTSVTEPRRLVAGGRGRVAIGGGPAP